MKKLNSCLLSAVMVASSLGAIQADTIDKIVGSDRFDTAAKIADRLGSYNTAVLVNGYSTADGLSASSFAAYKNAPILLTKANNIPETTLQRLRNVSKVYIIGGTSAISSGVETQLRKQGKTVIRLYGSNRTQTSIEVAKAIGKYNKAFIVNGYSGEADAMSVSPVAARDKAPIIITNGKTAPTLRDSDVTYYSIGGTSVISNSLNQYYRATRLSGSNRYETNKKVLERFYPNSGKYYYANGATLVDALAVSTLASNDGVALVSKNSDKDYLSDKDLIQIGGMDFNVNPSPGGEDTTNPGGEDTTNPGEDWDPGYPDDPSIPMPRPLRITIGNPTVTVNQGDVVSVSNFNISAKNYKDQMVPQSLMTFETSPNTTKAGSFELRIKIRDELRGCYEYADVTLVVKASKPTEKVYDVYSMEFQNIVRDEFYKHLDAHRAANGVPASEHRWELEESTLIKSKYMIEKGYINHDSLYYPHLMGSAEACASAGQIFGPYTEKTARDLGKSLFEQWRDSPKHNEILLSDSTDELNGDYNVNGFSFWAGETGYGNHYIFAAYHSAPSGNIRE